MLTPASIAFLKRLLDTPGPSGFETAPARVWREEAKSFGAEITSDVSGNSMATINPQGSPTIMLDGHIDEIGVIVQHIDDEGYVHISPIGGWDPQVLVAQRIRFITEKGDVFGVIGKKPIHLIKPEDREKATKLTELWVDIGAKNKAEAAARLTVGDPGVIDGKSMDFPNGRLVSRSIDDRIGAFVVLEALRRYAAKPGKAKVVAVATTQEEIAWNGGGALVCAQCVNPQMAVVVDVTFATDHPGLEKKELGDHALGAGPVLSRGGLISPVAFRLIRDAAERMKMSYSLHGVGRDTSTNADAIAIAREGIATALVSIPNRYMHSPNEMVDLADVDAAADLLAEACRTLDASIDFTDR
jgi:putative aminopeptidase FrvX